MREENVPFRLKTNRMSYLIPGGRLIERFLGQPEGENPMASQMWVASTVQTVLGDGNLGYSQLMEEDGGGSFPARLAEKPEEMLGEMVACKFGNSPGFLLKLLNSDDRLLVQTHPDGEKAKRYFNLPFGKTEAWYVIDTEKDVSAYIWAGFKPGVSKEYFRHLIEKQDTDEILNQLHRFEIHPGDVILIQPGEPHAMGSGSLVAEIQEPVDLTLRAERFRPDGSELPVESLHSGIGIDGLLDCFCYLCQSHEDTRKRLFVEKETILHNGWREEILIGSKQTKCFGMNRLVLDKVVERENNNFVVGLVLAGEGILTSGSYRLSLKKGTEFFIPASVDSYSYIPCVDVERFTIIECYPPQNVE